MNPSHLILFIAIVLLQIGCTSKKSTPIQFQSNDYEFNQEIAKIVSNSGDVSYGATRYSFVSEHYKLLKTLEINDTTKQSLPDSIWDTISDLYTAVPAKNYILDRAEQYDIIMINENHYVPRHRHFVKSLLEGMYERGFRYLALEAIGMLGDGTMYDKELNERGYPTIHTGFYTKEPEFSLLIREAISLGYHIIGYDEGSTFGYSGGDREQRGAENILRQLESLNPEGKLIVYCGWDHIKEGHSGTYWEYALAERLKQKTNKDVLTINQTEYSERLELNYEQPLMQRLDVQLPSVLVDNIGTPLDISQDTSWYDIFIIHPRTKFENHIPSWILNEGPAVQYDLKKVAFEPPYKIFVFEKGDNVGIASPIYVMESLTKEPSLGIPSRGKSIKVVITNKKESTLIW